MSSEVITRPLVPYLRLREELTVDLISWPAGAGKTRTVLQDVIRDVGDGAAVLWLTQTVGVLQEATYARLTGIDRSDGFDAYLPAAQVERHNVDASARDAGKSVGAALSDSLNEYLRVPQREGRVFLASWQGYLQAFKLLEPWVKNSALRLVIDEMPNIRRHEVSYIADASAAAAVRWDLLLDTTDTNNLRMCHDPEFQNHWRRARGRRGAGPLDAVTQSLPVLADCLFGPELWLSTMLERGEMKTYFSMYLRPEILNIGGSVEILAANAEDSLMFKIYSQCGVNFRTNIKYAGQGRLDMQNGESFVIVPLQKGRLSKHQYTQDAQLAKKLVAKAAHVVGEKFRDGEPFIFCLPAPVRLPPGSLPTGARKTSSGLAGSNDYKDYLAAAYLAAINLESIYAVELRERWGISREELDLALGIEHCYQYAMRIKGRHGRKVIGEKYLVIAGGMEMAQGLQRKIPGAKIDASYIESSPSVQEAGRRGSGLLGSLPEVLTKAQKNRLTGYCRKIQDCPQMELTKAMLKGLAQVASEIGKEREPFTADFLKVARGEATGCSVFTAGEYQYGMKYGKNFLSV